MIGPAIAWPADRSVPLQNLLQSISRSGVLLIYSSETISPAFRVTPPSPDLPIESQLKAMLTPFHLEAQPLPNGGFVIVHSTGKSATLEITVKIERDGVISLLPGAEVSLLSTQQHAHTDPAGRASFADLESGDYPIEVRFAGARTIRRTVRVTPERATNVEMHLIWDPLSLEEITITGNRYDAGTTLGILLPRETLESFPTTSSDAARSLQLLPGAAVAGYSAKTHVRGSRDDETLFRYDGLTLTDPYHLEAFQSLISAIDPAVIESTTSWTGVAPIQFGGRIGAVLDMEPRAITHPAIDAKLSNRDAGLLLGTPFDDARGTVFAGARLSNAYSPAQWPEPDSFSPNYRDYVLRSTWDVSPHMRLIAGGLALDDRRDMLSSNTWPTDQRARVDDHASYGWLRLLQEFVPSVRSEMLLSRESSTNSVIGRLDLGGMESGFLSKSDRTSSWTVREEVTVSPRANWSLMVGAERTSVALENNLFSDADFPAPFVPGLQPNAEMQQDSDISLKAVANAFYGGLQWQLSDRTFTDVGVRRDSRQYKSMVAGDSHWSTRANLRQRVSEATLIRLGWGQTSQASVFDVSRTANGLVHPAPARLLNQVNLSVEQVVASRWLLRTQIYDKREHSAFQTLENVFSPFSLLPEIDAGTQFVSTQSSRMRGFETRLESDGSWPLSGWISYSWSRAEDNIANQWVPRSWDQPNAVQLGTRWHQGPWQMAGLFSWHTGWPYTPLVVSNTSGPSPNLLSVALGPRNSARLENFASLDLRVSWEHAFAGGIFRASIELNDVTNAKTVCCQSYSLSRSPNDTFQLADSPGYWLGFSPLLAIRWQR